MPCWGCAVTSKNLKQSSCQGASDETDLTQPWRYSSREIGLAASGAVHISFFKSLLRGGIFLRVKGARLQTRQAELMQPFADRAFVHFDREAARHLCAQIDTPPAHNLVRHRVWSLYDQRLQLRQLLLGQHRGTTGSRARLQTIDAFVVVAMHPVTQRLPVHTAQFGRFGSRIALQNKRNGQQPSNLRAIAAFGSKSTKLVRIMLRPPHRQCSSHPIPPSCESSMEVSEAELRCVGYPSQSHRHRRLVLLAPNRRADLRSPPT